MKRTLKKIIPLLLILVGGLLMYYGIKLGDIAEIIANGTTLCLSCIGIG